VSKNRGLGRGFDALIPTELDQEAAAVVGVRPTGELIRKVSPADIAPNPHQPRTDFDDAELQGLASSIKAHGILHPPVVSEAGGGKYELIAGERRVRAAKLAGLTEIPVIVRSYDDQQKLELALLENVQRSQLNPIETAVAYKKLADEFNLTLEQIGERMGKAKSTVANIIRLLQLPTEARQAVVKGDISEAHARTILALNSPEAQAELLQNIIKHKLSVRQAEELVKAARPPKEAAQAGGGTPAPEPTPEDVQLTQSLSDYLGTKVSLQPATKGGKLVIDYYSDVELERIVETIKPGDVGAPVR